MYKAQTGVGLLPTINKLTLFIKNGCILVLKKKRGYSCSREGLDSIHYGRGYICRALHLLKETGRPNKKPPTPTEKPHQTNKTTLKLIAVIFSVHSCSHGILFLSQPSSGAFRPGSMKYSSISKRLFIVITFLRGCLSASFSFCVFLSGLVVPESRGNETVPEVATTSGYALLHFFSDAAYNLTGFNIAYAYVHMPTPVSLCLPVRRSFRLI